MTALDRLLDALRAYGLEPRQHGAQWECRCPAHDDRRASFGFTQPNGKVLLKCQTGCTTEEIVAALGLSMRDLFDDTDAVKPREVAAYTYTNEAAQPLFQVVRFQPKDFRQRKPDGTWGIKGVRRVLYNLPAVLAVAADGGTVLIVEGEKDADRFNRDADLADGTIVATCNPGGAGGGWRDDYNIALKGAHVVVVADRDDAGRKHAAAVARSVRPHAASVRIVEAAQGKDLFDHLEAGLGLGQLVNISDAIRKGEQADEPDAGTVAAEDLVADRAAPAKKSLAEVLAVYRRHLRLEDDYPVLAVLATYAANRLPLGAPVWLMVVGPSSGGKTESIMPLDGLPGVVIASNIPSVGALLSGTSKKERAAHASGGLLREVGDEGVLILKDFTSILSMHRDSRSEVLSAFREVYDGKFVRFVGSDGGQRLEWNGRLGLIAACTPVLDQYHSVAGLMGERFITVRLPMLSEEAVSRQAVGMLINGSTARREMNEAVRGLFEGLERPERMDSPTDLIPTLHAMTRLAVLGRAGVDRDGYSREITFVPGEEGTGRLVGQLVGLLFGLEMIGCDRDLALDVVRRVAFDCIPKNRAAMIRALLAQDTEATTKQLATQLSIPTATAYRALEELLVYGLAYREAREDRAGQEGKDGRADAWTASTTLRDLYREAGLEEPC